MNSSQQDPTVRDVFDSELDRAHSLAATGEGLSVTDEITVRPTRRAAHQQRSGRPHQNQEFVMSPHAFGLTPAQTATVLGAACRAPSLLNTQPWRFEIGSDHISVHLDDDRVLPGTDPDGREARISCGAALFNLKAALVDLGLSVRVRVHTHVEAGPLARIEVTGRRAPLRQDRELAQAIWRRATNRRPFSDISIPLDALHDLRAAASTEGATLTFAGAPSLHSRIRYLSNSAARTQLEDARWLGEWTAWTGRDHTLDGVPSTAAGLPPAAEDLWDLKDFGLPDRRPRMPGKEYEHTPLIAVLGTWDDHASSRLRAGQALQRVLLTATVHGISASFLSQLIEVPTARDALRDMLKGPPEPQVVLRIGYGTPVPPTPRRPFTDCLHIPAGDARDTAQDEPGHPPSSPQPFDRAPRR